MRKDLRTQQVIDWHARIDRLSGALASRWQVSAPPARDGELERMRQAWTDAQLGFDEAMRAHLLGAD